LLAVGDIYSPTLGRFTESGEPVAVVTLPASSHEYGNIYFDHEMRINRLVEKPQQGQANYVLAGIFVLPHEFLRRLEKADQDILECFQDYIAQGQFHAQLWEKGWLDMVHPWHILEANKMILNQWATASIDTSAQLRGNVRIEGAVRIEGNVVIESGSVLKGPCLIGKGSYIGNNVLIRNHSVVGPKSLVGYGCELKNCIAFGGNDIGRLSFLGDSVLGVIVSAILYRLYPQSEEGALTRMRAQVVKKDTLAQIARRLQLGNYLNLGGSAGKGGGTNNDSILADALESLIGAVYLDAGLEQAQNCVEEIFEQELSAIDLRRTAKDPKTELQELLQSRGMLLPKYKVESISGSSHEPDFVVSCYVEANHLVQTGTGSSRKSAEQAAAKKLLLILR